MSFLVRSTAMILFLLVLVTGGYSYDDAAKPWLLPDGIEEDEPIAKEVGELKEPPGGVLLNGDCSDAVDLSGLVLPIEPVRGQIGPACGATI